MASHGTGRPAYEAVHAVLRIEAMAGVALLLSTLIALVLSNTAWSAQFLAFWEMHAGFRLGGVEFSRSLKHWINDGLMTLFFFVIALETRAALTTITVFAERRWAGKGVTQQIFAVAVEQAGAVAAECAAHGPGQRVANLAASIAAHGLLQNLLAMGAAFDRACSSLRHRARAEKVRELLARRIIEAARNGELDPVRLHSQAVNGFGIDDVSMPVVSAGRTAPSPAYAGVAHAA